MNKSHFLLIFPQDGDESPLDINDMDAPKTAKDLTDAIHALGERYHILEFEKEFLDEVTLPDPKLAEEHWQQAREELSQGTRWCRGHEVGSAVPDEVLVELDLESRWEACLRGKVRGTWHGTPLDLEAFGQRM